MKSSMTARVTSVSMLISALLMVAGPANAQHNMDGMGRHASDDEACQPQLMQGHGKLFPKPSTPCLNAWGTCVNRLLWKK